MKIASWNVNSLNVRLPQVLTWLETHQPDMLCLQEIKMEDHKFPIAELKNAGWHCCYAGQKSYNGVAIISKTAPEEIIVGLPTLDDAQKRLIGASFDGLWVYSTYVPNGETLTSDKYTYKLNWLDHFIQFAKTQAHQPAIFAGDFNIAPDDRDVYDPKIWKDRVVVSEPERAAFKALCDAGYWDSFRLFEQPENIFSWWDYRTRGFLANRGLRIDMAMVSTPLKDACQKAWIDKEPRGAERPSDHAPVIIEIDWPIK